ncbi:VOC family protein [Paenibacillus wulumuqiensis]|uniref:VOC family protein n=1 Tax=Paenibacillus wulumuqiensis TaxID=1567107 RepID=UPI0006196C34|nr:VOC family protein [Paenibacillus wulumuqiensis]
MTNPIQNKIRGVFIPVSNIEQARDWYCSLLGLPSDEEIYFGHIYVLPMQGGINIILDSKIYSPHHVHNIPVLQLATDHIDRSYDYLKSQGVGILTEIQDGHWFNIQDPDGNVLMICK